MKRKNFLDFQDKEYRDEYVAQYIDMGISSQMKAIREQRGYSQKNLGELAGMKQAAIARLENPEYEKLNTLKRIAAAFDVGLLVRFVPYGELVKWKFSPETFKVPSFPDDTSLKDLMENPTTVETIDDERLIKAREQLFAAYKEEQGKAYLLESQTEKDGIREPYNTEPQRTSKSFSPTGA